MILDTWERAVSAATSACTCTEQHFRRLCDLQGLDDNIARADELAVTAVTNTANYTLSCADARATVREAR